MTRKEKRTAGMVFFRPTLLLLLMIDWDWHRCRFCCGTIPPISTAVHSTPPTRHPCDGKDKAVTQNTPKLFSASDSGNLTLNYQVISGHVDTNIKLIMLHTVGEEASEPCRVEWPIVSISNKYGKQTRSITFSYNRDTKTTHVQGEQVGSQSYTGYKLMDVEVRTSGRSWWSCSIFYSPMDDTTKPETNAITATLTCPIAPSNISNHSEEHGLIIGVCVVGVTAVISLCGLAYYCKKTQQIAAHHDDPGLAKPTVEMVGVATGLGADVAAPKPAGEEHIYEEWNESYLRKDQQRGSTHSSINSIYQDYQPKDQQRGSTHSDVNSIYQPFDA